MLQKVVLVLVGILISISASRAQAGANNVFDNILSMQQRAAFVDDIIGQRVNTLLPGLMNQHDIDMWLLISRE